jgi:hypothetical protein
MGEHIHGNYHTQQEFDEAWFYKGDGDPDKHGHYPGQPEEQDCELCIAAGIVSV